MARKNMTRAEWIDRLFIGCLGNGLTFADRGVEEHGDFRKIAHFQPETMALTLYGEEKTPAMLLELVREYCADLRERKGQLLRLAGNVSVEIGCRAQSGHTEREIDMDLATFVAYMEGNSEAHNATQERIVANYIPKAWVGRLNASPDGCQLRTLNAGETGYGHDFVVPCFDSVLMDMVEERIEAPYKGTVADGVRLDAIFARIEELGGKVLVWA